MTGRSSVDRAKLGSKHHLLVEGKGVPLSASLTGANRHDITQLLDLVESIPPVRGKRGHPRHKPVKVQGDRAYDSEPHRRALRKRRSSRSLPSGARRRQRAGQEEIVMERSLSWLHQFRKLRVREEIRSFTREAFMLLACSFVAHRF